MQKSRTCTACGGKTRPGSKVYGSGYCSCHAKKPNDIYVGNFLSVYRVRPENEGENSDDEDDKEDLVVTAGDLAQACDTHVPVHRRRHEKRQMVSAPQPHRGCHRTGEDALENASV